MHNTWKNAETINICKLACFNKSHWITSPALVDSSFSFRAFGFTKIVVIRLATKNVKPSIRNVLYSIPSYFFKKSLKITIF